MNSIVAAHKTQGCVHSVTAVALLNEQSVMSGGADGEMKQWDLRRLYSTSHPSPIPANVVPHQPGEARRGITSLSLDAAGTNLLACCTNHKLFLFRGIDRPNGCTKTPQVFRSLWTGAFHIKAVLSPDSRYIVSGSRDNAAYMWEIDRTAQPVCQSPPWVLDASDGQVSALDCTTDRETGMPRVVSALSNNTCQLWQDPSHGHSHSHSHSHSHGHCHSHSCSGASVGARPGGQGVLRSHQKAPVRSSRDTVGGAAHLRAIGNMQSKV